MVAQIGAPAQWRRHEGLAIDPADCAGNVMRADFW